MTAFGARLVPLFAAFVLAACSTVDVSTSYDHSAAFGSYATYSLAPGPEGRKLPTWCEMTLRRVLRTELAKRGLEEATGPDAHLAIVWHVFLTEKEAPRPATDPDAQSDWPFQYGYYGTWSGAPASYAFRGSYDDGTLILDVVDMRARKLVFRGTAIAASGNPERSARNIEKAVTRMVAELPAPR